MVIGIIKKDMLYISVKLVIQNIEKKQHTWQSSDKKIDKVLRNNPDRYDYFVLAEGEFTDTELDNMEIQAISIFKTNKYKYPDKSVFNFTDGGGGMRGYKFSQETKTKMSKAAKKKNW